MRFSISGEALQSIPESAESPGDALAARLGKGIDNLVLLENEELAGRKIMVLDPNEHTMRHLLVFDKSPMDEKDYEALWEESVKRWDRELDS
jgi:hypothetical protein